MSAGWSWYVIVLVALNTSTTDIRHRNMKMIHITRSPLNSLLARSILSFITNYVRKP